MPTIPHFTDGWQLGEPHQIIELPEVQIPATGADYFPTPSIALDLKEDRWIRAIEIRPGNRIVTHHSVIFSTSVNMMAATANFTGKSKPRKQSRNSELRRSAGSVLIQF